MVRRRRNNPTWATDDFDPEKDVFAVGKKDSLLKSMKEYAIADQLMMCWGIGPSKVNLHNYRNV